MEDAIDNAHFRRGIHQSETSLLLKSNEKKRGFWRTIRGQCLDGDVTICTKGHVLRISIIDIYSIRVCLEV